jgi:hypothetical protein
MLDTSHANLRAEVEAGKRLRKTRMSQWESMIQGYHGPAYDSGAAPYESENTAFEIVSNLNPQLVFSNPRVKLGSSRPTYQEQLVRALEAAGNRWIEETNPRQLYEEICVDWDFAWGVIHTAPSKVHGLGRDLDDPIYRPSSVRISPGEFVADARAKTFRSARFMTHPVSEDKDDLIERAERENKEAKANREPPPWNMAALHALNEGEGEEELQHERHAHTSVPHRKTVTYYPVWVPEAKLPKGYSPSEYSGMIFYVTLSDPGRDGDGKYRKRKEGDDGFIRRPEPFYGPRWGAYSFFQAYPVPDKQHPLAIMPANLGNHQALNRQADANMAANERRKTIAFVDDMDPDLQQKVEEAPDGSVIPAKIQSIRDGVREVQLGGASAEGLQAQAIALDTRNRGIGLSDASKGSPDPRVSATADVISDRSMTRKVAALATRFQVDGVAMHLKTVLWYIYADDRAVLFLGTRSADVGMNEAVWVGGHGKGQRDRIRKEFPESEAGSQLEEMEVDEEQEAKGYERYLSDFDLLGVSVEPYSMQRSDDPAMQARAMQAMGILLQIAPAVVQAPWVDWQPVLERLGDSLNWPGFADIIKWQLANEVASKMLQAPPEATGQPAQRGAGAIRLAGDVGQPSKMLQPRRSEPAAKPFEMAANGY